MSRVGKEKSQSGGRESFFFFFFFFLISFLYKLECRGGGGVKEKKNEDFIFEDGLSLKSNPIINSLLYKPGT